jgi:hypothetical protein
LIYEEQLVYSSASYLRNSIEGRREEGDVSRFGPIPEDWVPPTIKLMRMNATKYYGETDGERTDS